MDLFNHLNIWAISQKKIFKGFSFSISLLILGIYYTPAFAAEASKPSASHERKKATDTLVAKGGDNALLLKKTIEQAIQTNPEISANAAEKQSVEQRVDQAKGGYYPTLDVRAGGGYAYVNQKYRISKLNPVSNSGSQAENRYDPGVSLKQMVFDGFETPSKIDKAENETSQASKKVAESRELVGYNAANYYIEVRRYQRLLQAAKENLEEHRKILAKVKTLLSEEGKVTVADLYKVEARLHDAEANVQDIEGSLNKAIAFYTEVVGQEPGTLKSAQLPRYILPTSLQDALALGRKKNKSLAVVDASVKVAASDVAVASSSVWPTLHLEADGRRTFNPAGLQGTESEVTVLAVVRYNVFNGGRDAAKKREYSSRLTQAKLKRDQELRKTDREIRLAWAEMMSSRQQAESLRQAVKSKKSVRTAFVSQFDLGTRNFLDILDAIHEWYLAKNALITADATEDKASVRLLASMGHLLDSFQVKV